MTAQATTTKARDPSEVKAKVGKVSADLTPGEQKNRTCLSCGAPFESEWPGERVCRRCKSSATWRQG